MAKSVLRCLCFQHSYRYSICSSLKLTEPVKIEYYQIKSNYGTLPTPPPLQGSLAQYGGRHMVTMLPGHGIGPEMMAFVREVFRYAGIPVDFEEILIDADSENKEDVHMAITSIMRNGTAIKGNIETKFVRPDIISRNVILRQKLDLFAYVMHTKSFPAIKTRHNDLDIVIIRQNTEGEYSMLEHENVKGVVESIKFFTRTACERIGHYAFQYARKYNRKKVTAVHKANIMKLSDGLFLQCCTEVAKEYPDIEFNNMIIDNCCMQLVANPEQFDVMLTSNLYGNIIGNLVCGLIGGAGLCSGRNYGEKYAVFEPGTRNTGTGIVGKKIANPVAMMNASADLLEHLNLEAHSTLLRKAINKTINEDKILTPDVGGQATSEEVVQNIIKEIQEKMQKWRDARKMSQLPAEQ